MADKRRSRYGRYDGGPDPLAPPVDIAEALDAIGQDVMAGYSPERAMREFLRRGGSDRTGLDDLARRVAERRRELTQRHNLDGTLEEVRELLDRAVLEERKQLARDVELDDADRAFREMQLENLPSSVAAAVSELSDYDWQSRQAREDYEKIKDLLGRELLDQRFAGMKQALENATDEDRAGDQRDARRPQPAARQAPPRRGHPGRLRRVHGQARRLLPGEPAQRRRAARLPRPAGGGRAADAQLDVGRAARGADAALRAGVRLAPADGVARPARREPPVAAARRGLGRLRADGGLRGARPRRRHRRLPGHRRPRRARRAALPVVRRRPHGRPRPRQAGPPARRRRGRRRPHPPAARAGAARLRLPQARLRRPAPAEPEGDAPARQGAAQGRRQPDVRAPGPARPAAAPGRPASSAAPAGSGRSATPSRGTSPAPSATPYAVPRPTAATRAAAYASTSATSRSARPRPAPRRPWRCWSTRRSRWRWTAAGCR